MWGTRRRETDTEVRDRMSDFSMASVEGYMLRTLVFGI